MNLRTAFIISFIIHTGIFFIPINKKKKIIYITFPVQLLNYTGSSDMSSLPFQKNTKETINEKKEGTVISKKIIKKEKIKIVDKEEKLSSEKETNSKNVSGNSTDSRGTGSGINYGGIPGISVEGAKFPYIYYLNQIRSKISDNWQYNKQTGNLRTVVYFIIKPDGKIENVKIKESSGDDIFDTLCLRAVKLSSPFAPLPSGYSEQYLGIYFEFSFHE